MRTIFILFFLAPVLLSGRVNHAEWLGQIIDSENYYGCAVLMDLADSSVVLWNPARCDSAFLPASTFKVPNSLIALESNVADGPGFIIKWDSTEKYFKSWERDHTLKSALQNSVVWYYQELARRIGTKRMQLYIDLIGYGNCNIGGGIDEFWLQGDIRISAMEQLRFLKSMHNYELPFSAKNIDIVKSMMLKQETDELRIYGKTGTSIVGKVAWLVGFVEFKGRQYAYVINIMPQNADFSEMNRVRMNIVNKIAKYLMAH